MSLKRLILLPVIALTLLFISPLQTPAKAAELIMVDQEGCPYCRAWEAKIGPIYPKTPEGKFAPLRVQNIHDGAPNDIKYARGVSFTPTFILIENQEEVARIEGYPGEDFFWWMLEKMLKEHTDFAGGD